MNKFLSTFLALLLFVGSAHAQQRTGGASPTGAAGGDLGGSYPNPTVTSGSHLSGTLGTGLTSPNQITTGPQLQAPRRHKLTWMTGGQILSNVVASQKTYFYAYPIPDDAYAVRLIIPILAASNGATLGPIRYRPSSQFLTSTGTCSGGNSGDDYVNPCDPTTILGGSGWNYLTFCGNGIDEDQSAGGPRIRQWGDADCTSAASGVPGVTQIVLPTVISPDPTTGSTANGRLIVSDWNQLVTLVRSDAAVTAPRVIMFRVVVPAGTVARVAGSPWDSSETGSTWAGNASLNQGYDFSVKTKTGDIETGANITGTATSTGDGGPIAGVQFLVRNKGISIVSAPGDSHTMGNTTTGNMSSLGLRLAVGLSSQNVPFMSANAGWSGAASPQFTPSAMDLIDIADPSICLIQTWGYADGNPPATGIAAAWLMGRALAVGQRCIKRGGKAVYLTPFPRNLSAGAGLTWWTNMWTEVTGMADASSFVFDVDAILSQQSGGVPTGQYVAIYTGDNQHPNEAGITALLPGFTTQLRNIAGCPSSGACQ